ncbi:hypothetical protein KZZ52_51700 [Dactylosporangium sp. AC04546]|uniref:hypothetical protein n=1 Tax=Dactylosporangium sp. AC04546 TaxID=2862460 RepID=UPI001EDDE23B|nr:hypothetical protein [Dactylosporangium sp. AC04546]WVK82327.1 hypothetical protein KZZ52_51700 [Dactylosporangium sp. AC04546]
MSEELHPNWCSRAVCTAYGPAADEYHRSEPIVVRTDDPRVDLFISKVADPDGTNEYIEITALERDDQQPWHLREPVRGMCLPRASADAAWRAMAELV